MLIQYLWVPILFISIFTLAYLIILKKITKEDIKKKITTREFGQQKIIKNKKSIEPFGLFMVPVKNKLLYLTPHKITTCIERLTTTSGTTRQVGDIIIFKFFLAISSSLITFLVLQNSVGVTRQAVFVLIFGALGFMVPDFFLKRKTKVRQQSIKRSLPAFIDYLLISVEAGMGLDMALSRVISKLQGPLAEEVANTLTEIKYGKSKRDAFKNLATRTNVPEFTTFLTALISGEQLGVSLGNILKVQGRQIREKKKQEVQEKAYKISIKLLFPLVFFILPGLFVVLLGPALLKVFGSL